MSVKAPTLQDVARVAGVSTATASRALTRPDKVAEATRRVVQEAVQATQYRANRVARNLRTQRADAALALLPDLANPFFSTLLEGMANHLAQSGISMLVADGAQLDETGEELVDYFESGRVDCLICCDGSCPNQALEQLAALPTCRNIVFVGEWVEGNPSSSVRCENETGTRLAICHLYDLGHRKIGLVPGPVDNVLTPIRRDEALAELADKNIAPPAHWVCEGDFTLEAGAKAAQAWLAMPADNRPTAFFCACDISAFGLISELAKHGVQVPRDLSVVGFDDIELAAAFIPSLTTIRQDRRELGLVAARLLTGDTDSTQQVHQVPVELIARSSTAAPKA